MVGDMKFLINSDEHYHSILENLKKLLGIDLDIQKIKEYPVECELKLVLGDNMKREDVYKLIDGERDYQNERWKNIKDEKWSPTDWCVFIRQYLEKAEVAMLGASTIEIARNNQMANIRKIAALAVAAMEYNDTPDRYSL